MSITHTRWIQTLFLSFLTAACLGSCSKSATELTMESFRFENGEYGFMGLEWGSSVNSVIEAVPLEEYKLDLLVPPEEKRLRYYAATTSFLLDGNSARAEFEFFDGKLSGIQLSFNLRQEDSESFQPQEWLENQLKRAEELYGNPFFYGEGMAIDREPAFPGQDRLPERENQRLFYEWSTEDTTLLFSSFVQPSGKAENLSIEIYSQKLLDPGLRKELLEKE